MLVTFLDINTDKQVIKLCLVMRASRKLQTKTPAAGSEPGLSTLQTEVSTILIYHLINSGKDNRSDRVINRCPSVCSNAF